jgi:hypothetical protein
MGLVTKDDGWRLTGTVWEQIEYDELKGIDWS